MSSVPHLFRSAPRGGQPPASTIACALGLVLGLTTLAAAAARPAAQSAQGAQGAKSAQGAQSDAARLEAQAIARYNEDDLVDAERLYREAAAAARAAPERARLRVDAAWIAYLRQDLAGAGAELERAFLVTPDIPFRAENYDDSFAALFRQTFARRESLVARQVAEQIGAAVREIEARRYDTARPLLEAALKLRPDDPAGLYNLSLVDAQQGRKADAMTRLQRLVTIATMPRTDPLRAAELPSVPPTLHARALVDLAQLSLDNGMADEGTRLLEEAVELDRGSRTAWLLLGRVRRQRGEAALAAKALERARELAPEDPAITLDLAAAHLDAGALTEAVRVLDQGLARHPGRPDLQILRAETLLAQNKLQPALDSLDRFVAADAANTTGHLPRAERLRAQLLYRLERPQEAAEAAAKAQALEPGVADAWVWGGLAHAKLGQWPDAARALERASSLAPNDGTVAHALGNALFALGRYREAVTAYERALAVQPELTEARHQLVAAQQRLASTAAVVPTGNRGPRTADPPEAVRPRGRGRDRTPAGPLFGLRVVDERHAATGLPAARVELVAPGQAADRAGLRAGDFILRFDGQPVTNAAELLRRLAALQPGGVARLDLVRDDRSLRLDVSP